MSARRRPRSLPRDGQLGVTLIEVLVVLVIVAVASGITLLGMSAADRGARAESEAVRLARHLSLAVDEALIDGQPQALVWDAGGYRFLRWDDAGWQAAALPLLATRHDLRPPVVLGQGELPQTGAGDTPPLIIAPGANGPAVQFALAGGGAAWAVEFNGFSARAYPAGAP